MFSEWGLAYHNIIEKFINDEYFLFELKDKYIEFANQCPFKFPPNKYVDLHEKTYTGIMNHFDDFSWIDDYEILSCEEKRKYDIHGYPFVSIADLEVKIKENNKLAIVDHKISTTFKKADVKKKIKQLYIYSYSFYEKYDQYPDYLIFNHFKNNEIVQHKFDIDIYEKTIEWLLKKIEFISKQTEFPARCEIVKDKTKDFFSLYLCGHRRECEFRPYITCN